jgi:hypothetical protein
MRTKLLISLSLPLVSLGACKWTEFDDLRDEAWVRATSKPDGSKSSNWGVAIVRGKATSESGGRLAVFGTASSRLNEIQYDDKGGAKQLAEQNLGNIGIANLAVEPIVLADPNTDDFALITQGSSSQVVVAAGGDSNLLQFIINGATSVEAATYLRAPAIDSDEAHGARTMIQASQPIISAGNTLFGTYFVNPDAPGAFIQPKCALTDSVAGTNVEIRALGAVPAGDGSDDLAVWTSTGDMIILDGHVFNGERAGTATPLCPGGTLDVATSTAVIKPAAPVGFTPDVTSFSQIIAIDDRFALLQGHTNSASLLAVWDFKDPASGNAGVIVGSKVEEAGVRSAALFNDGGVFHVVAGYPSAIVDGVASGKVLVYPMDTTAGINGGADETFTDSQPEDGQAFGRSVTTIEFNGSPVISVAGNNEVFTYFRTPTLYSTDRRTGR